MIVLDKLAPAVLAVVCVMMAGAANAASASGGSTPALDSGLGNISGPVGNLSSCVDLKGDCSTLMVNYYSDSVEFALIQRGRYKESASGAEPAAGSLANSKSKLLSGNTLAASDGDIQLLGVDFLRGLQRKGDAPGNSNHTYGTEQDALAAAAVHDWAFAAATSLKRQHQQAASHHNNFVPSHLGKDLTTFWDFEHVYQWQVDVDILDDGASDLAQVVLSNIYLSAKTNSRGDALNVVCELNNPDNC